MAYDKVIDSAALEANLKTVADAIRGKTGTSDSLAFPAGFAEAIAAIEAGGGGFVSSQVTFATDTKLQYYVHTHNLGFVPQIALVYHYSGSSSTTSSNLMSHIQVDVDSNNAWFLHTASTTKFNNPSGGSSGWDQQATNPVVTDTTIEFHTISSALYMRAGVTYEFVVAGMEV